jgi:hypothetical protein
MTKFYVKNCINVARKLYEIISYLTRMLLDELETLG